MRSIGAAIIIASACAVFIGAAFVECTTTPAWGWPNWDLQSVQSAFAVGSRHLIDDAGRPTYSLASRHRSGLKPVGRPVAGGRHMHHLPEALAEMSVVMETTGNGDLGNRLLCARKQAGGGFDADAQEVFAG
jgi:hypothetical protein